MATVRTFIEQETEEECALRWLAEDYAAGRIDVDELERETEQVLRGTSDLLPMFPVPSLVLADR